uniref:Uncharacterized protein n=1 Tax=Globodera rostochiensis TaxID=31243 RepID=A0A914H2D9_GLORO
MEEFWILILVALFATNLVDKAKSVKLEETPHKTFDEIFGEGWWNKDEAEDLKMPPSTDFGQNVHHQIDRQNTQIGQIEPNSTDQNPPLTDSDERKQKFDQRKAELKRGGFKNSYKKEIEKTVAKELGISYTTIYNWKRELGQTTPKHIYSDSEQKELMKRYFVIKDKNPKIRDGDIAKMLKIGGSTLSGTALAGTELAGTELARDGVSGTELARDGVSGTELAGRSGVDPYSSLITLDKLNPIQLIRILLSQCLITLDKLDPIQLIRILLSQTLITLLMLKMSENKEIEKTVAKELGISYTTIYNWKRELGQTTPKHIYSDSEQKELMKRYFLLLWREQ